MLLTDKYFPRTVRVQKERVLLSTSKGVKLYEMEFVELSKYVLLYLRTKLVELEDQKKVLGLILDMPWLILS